MGGPGAVPEALDDVLGRFPLWRKGIFSQKHGVPVPTILHVGFALFQKVVNTFCLLLSTALPFLKILEPGITSVTKVGHLFNKSKCFVLHGVQMSWANLISAWGRSEACCVHVMS